MWGNRIQASRFKLRSWGVAPWKQGLVQLSGDFGVLGFGERCFIISFCGASKVGHFYRVSAEGFGVRVRFSFDGHFGCSSCAHRDCSSSGFRGLGLWVLRPKPIGRKTRDQPTRTSGHTSCLHPTKLCKKKYIKWFRLTLIYRGMSKYRGLNFVVT